MLREGYKVALPDVPEKNYRQITYHKTDPPAIIDISGSITIQFTPYQRKKEGDDCVKIARAVVWAEDLTEPVAELEWEV